MDKVLDFLKEFNLQTIISMAVIVWYFTRDLKKSIDAVDAELRKMNTRVARLEGSVYGKDIYEKISE